MVQHARVKPSGCVAGPFWRKASELQNIFKIKNTVAHPGGAITSIRVQEKMFKTVCCPGLPLLLPIWPPCNVVAVFVVFVVVVSGLDIVFFDSFFLFSLLGSQLPHTENPTNQGIRSNQTNQPTNQRSSRRLLLFALATLQNAQNGKVHW